MVGRITGLTLVLGGAILACAVGAKADTVRLTTLEWPPYSGSLPDNGFSSIVVREAFKAMGHTVSVEVLPWQRAVHSAKEEPGVVGYFPEYPAELDGFSLSDPIGESPLGLIVPAGAKIADPSPPGLARLKLGVVNGYVNAKPVGDAIATNGLKPEAVVDDTTNIRKVAAGRIEAAEIDRYVFSYLMRNTAELQSLQGKIEFGPMLESKTLHVAFNTKPEGRKWAAVFAEGLKKIDVGTLQKQHLSALAQ
ncbi:ABC transporter substrate-binding protein [Azospirillum sp. YIM B02556]|uniref:ABC transporter substrate-binding protein n=1 Tax=Azospirillum endophyticum TaxID=2800326 RepID=A0ABS1F4R5_9PROT|nr:transporter substrate-binding domain-containing protein [Azospirillum endophyticum]MBK1838416.1 ABC transporter substrate-binding protein [Azospirillum endophyticum]